MTIEDLTRQVQELQRKLSDQERAIAHLPSRIATPKGSGLPKGDARYAVLTILDDAGTVGWSYPRFTIIPN